MMSNYEGSSYLSPPANSYAYDGTHPSDHNGVYAFHNSWISKNQRKVRDAKIKKRYERDQKQMQKGKLDLVEKERYDRGLEHDTPFYYPIPLYYNNYGAGYGGCAGYAPNVVGQRDGTSCGGYSGSCGVGGGACRAGGCGSGAGPCSGGCGGGGSGGCGGGCGGGGGGGGCSGGEKPEYHNPLISAHAFAVQDVEEVKSFQRQLHYYSLTCCLGCGGG